jgi:DNA ligase-1
VLDNIAKVLNIIKNTSGYINKQQLLAKNENLPGLKKVLYFIYNPYNKTGISASKYSTAKLFAHQMKDFAYGSDPFIDVFVIMKYLEQHNTGTTEDLMYIAKFIKCVETAYNKDSIVLETAEAIVTQNLQIGVSVKTLNAVFGDKFIPVVGCMLGKGFEDVKNIEWPCVMTEKLDGIRRILIKKNGVCRFYSRSGHEDVGLETLLQEARYLPDNRVYDGELLADSEFTNNIAQRQATSSIAASRGVKGGLIFNVFDMLPIEDFFSGVSEDSALTRKIVLAATLMDESLQLLTEDWPRHIAYYGVHVELPHIKAVPILGLAKSEADVVPVVTNIWERGGEGVMLNTVAGKYEIKRSNQLVKVKRTIDVVLPVVDLIEGTGKYVGMLGAIVVDYKGTRVGVGSGFADYERIMIWSNPDLYIGKKVEIDTFGESVNQRGIRSLNCPIFKRFV